MFSAWDLVKSESRLRNVFASEEEYSPRALDKHGRFLSQYSTNRNIKEPAVSRYLAQHGFRMVYPNNHKFAVCLTHDVDEITPPLKHMLASSAYALKSFDMKGFARQYSWKFSRKIPSPYRNFEQIMEIESKYGARSTFFFMATDHDPTRYRYNINEVKNDLITIVKAGWEVGLHTGYYSFDDAKQIREEKEKLENVLGKRVIGCRNHYLRFKVPDTWELLERTGFEYDTTFGYADASGFRNGMCHPFKPINLKTGKLIDIVELPLNVMDSTFVNRIGSVYEPTSILQEMKELVDRVDESGGVLTVLWHNATFSCLFLDDLAKLYDSFLGYCREKGAWITSAEEIYSNLCTNTQSESGIDLNKPTG